jgi:(2R)-3-sulfolactate dehydrogenase (NADP+)
MIGRAFGNSPSAMPAWGGTRALFGTNPIAAVFPRRDGPPLSIDMSLSGMARGKGGGNPTMDPKAGLKGSMLPAGG